MSYCASGYGIGHTFPFLCFVLRYWPHPFAVVLHVTMLATPFVVVVLYVTILSIPFRFCASGYDSGQASCYCASGYDIVHTIPFLCFRLR